MIIMLLLNIIAIAMETSPTITRVEKAIKIFESKLTQIDELERQALINIDKEFQLKPKIGNSAMDHAVQEQRIRELKEVIRRAKDLQPRMIAKMREIIHILPKRERYRLIRRMNLGHRFNIGTELDVA